LGKTFWDVPVDIRYSKGGRVYTVTGTAYACEHLTTSWPDGAHGPSYYRAILACCDTVDGSIAHAIARSSFVEAARDALILHDGRWSAPHFTGQSASLI
jgi:hypothetical protein